MESEQLLSALKKEARQITDQDICLARAAIFDSVKDLPEKYRRAYSSDYFSHLYQAFQELRICRYPDKSEPIDDEEYRSLLVRICHQTDDGNSKHKAFHRFASVVIPYLVFIAKRTIHPVGMIFPGGLMIVSHEGEYYCPVKNKQSDVDVAVCDLCRCRDSEELDP
ncbi:DUF2115 domain-containing protein [Methanolobus chelungpuianus]|uniref:DUF2115 domain-containing protein n=1 Tax=Methanolobus chelungpuianus TaxID=502115 RepID=UPI00211492D1|nr:DUF2115 domain-containing protein [Methanolobus chelungpuianus]